MLAYFGTDQSQVQRYISGASLRESRLGLMFNAVFKIPMQFFILLLGVLLFVFYQFQPPPVFFNQVAWKHRAQQGDRQQLDELEAKFNAAHDEQRQSLTAGSTPGMAAMRKRRNSARDAAVKSTAADRRPSRGRPPIWSNPRKKTSDSDYVFITFILDYLPHGLIGLLVAAFFAAALSAKAAELNALASTTTIDFYRHVIKPQASDAHYLLASKCFTVMWGIVAICFALLASLAENLIQAVNIVGSIFYPVMLGLFLVGFFLRWIGGTAVFWGAVLAQVLVIAMFSFSDISYLWYNLIGCVACMLFSVLLQAALFRPSHPARPTTHRMSPAPVICFGQQPCGFFPRRYLFAKIQTARRLQAEIGGEIVFFCHDSDHDPRETKTTLRHRMLGNESHFNFEFQNKTQKKYSPLYLKRIADGWQEHLAQLLPEYVDTELVDAFRRTQAANVADFCLEMYRHLGLLEGIRVARSSDPEFRRAACEISDFFVDVPYRGGNRPGPACRWRIETAQRGRFLHHAAGHAVHLRTNQPHSRHAAALDAIGDPLHALRGRGE